MSYYGGWYDWDSGFQQIYIPSGGIEQGFFAGRPVVDVEGSIDLYDGTTLAVGAQNLFNTYPQESARAMSVGEQYSEYTPWGFNGAHASATPGAGRTAWRVHRRRVIPMSLRGCVEHRERRALGASAINCCYPALISF